MGGDYSGGCLMKPWLFGVANSAGHRWLKVIRPLAGGWGVIIIPRLIRCGWQAVVCDPVWFMAEPTSSVFMWSKTRFTFTTCRLQSCTVWG